MQVFFWMLLFLYSNAFLMSAKTEVYFSHSHNVTEKLTDKIALAKQKILIAIYMFTEKKIAQAIIDAKKKNPGLQIKMIVDKTNLEENSFSKIGLLIENGVDVFVFNYSNFDKDRKQTKKSARLKKNKVVKSVFLGVPVPQSQPEKTEAVVEENEPVKKSSWDEGLMHSKYVIIDDDVWTGSFNFTVKANAKNQENALYLKKPRVTKEFLDNFNNLEKFSEKVTLEMLKKKPEESLKNDSVPGSVDLQTPSKTITNDPADESLKAKDYPISLLDIFKQCYYAANKSLRHIFSKISFV